MGKNQTPSAGIWIECFTFRLQLQWPNQYGHRTSYVSYAQILYLIEQIL